MQWFFKIQQLTLIVHLLLLWIVQAHDFGLHGLTGESPSGNPLPLVPEITGPFEVKLMLRFSTINSPYHAIFHWTDGAGSSILFAYGTSGFEFRIDDLVHGNVTCLDPTQPMPPGNDLYEVYFSANGAELRVVVDGAEIASCASSIVSSSGISRTHHLAESPNAKAANMLGAVLGIIVTNTNGPPIPPIDRFKFWSLPSQILSTPTRLAVSAYIRFDSIAGRSWQRIFDFANDQFSDNFLCAQRAALDHIRCAVVDGAGIGIERIDSPPGSIVPNEWAFWHFEMDANATYKIWKDNVLLATEDLTGFPRGVFRRRNYIGRPNWASHPNIHGAILGFRLDVEEYS